MINTFLEILDKNKISYTEENKYGYCVTYSFILHNQKIDVDSDTGYHKTLYGTEFIIRGYGKDDDQKFSLGLKDCKDYELLKKFFTSFIENKSLIDLFRLYGKNLHYLNNKIILDLNNNEMTLDVSYEQKIGSDTWSWNWNYLGLGTRSIVEQFENIIDKNTGLNNKTNFTDYKIGDYELSVIFTTAYGKGTPYDYKYNELKLKKFSYQGDDFIPDGQTVEVRDSVCGLYYPPKERLLSIFLPENIKNYVWLLNRGDKIEFRLHDLTILSHKENKMKLNWR